MAIQQAVDRQVLDIAAAHAARVADKGSAAHPHCLALASATGPDAARDLADAVHLLCALYGRHSGLVDLAILRCPPGAIRQWLQSASDAFERERLYLVRLTSAVGPVPSTAGSAETESILSQQRHAIETLAISERLGCALGATTALVGDWAAIRTILDRAAVRMGVEVAACSLPEPNSMVAAIESGLDGVAATRAFGFGAEQLLLQNRGLLDLLEARAGARAEG